MLHKDMLNIWENLLEKCEFHVSNQPIDIDDAGIEKRLVSNKYIIGKKYYHFIVYINHFNGDINLLLTNLTKLSRSIKSSGKVKYVPLMFEERHWDIMKKILILK